MSLHRKRFFTQAGFFALFVLAPPLDIFRFDLTQTHFIVLGQIWSLGLDAFMAGEISAAQASLNLIVRGFLPIGALLALFAWVSWRYGRLYCGWLCPHFSVVETLNQVMQRAIGRQSLWERRRSAATPRHRHHAAPDSRWWWLLLPLAAGFAFLWALVLLTYLLPPAQVYAQLRSATLGPYQVWFLVVASTVFFIDFVFARHLFCRYGCAVGLFQSLVWMANPRALVIGFDARRSRDCADCHSACDQVCPMRLMPRAIKRRIFTCDQCGACIDACASSQASRQRPLLLRYVDGDCALDKSMRDFGRRPPPAGDCFPSTAGAVRDDSTAMTSHPERR